MSVFIASRSSVVTRLIETACVKSDMQTVIFESTSEFLKELKNLKPEIIFIDESFEEKNNQINISRLKESEDIGEAFIIFTSTNNSFSQIAYNKGADAFLPVPFSKAKFDSIIRQISGKPKQIMIASGSPDVISGLKAALKSTGFSLLSARSGEECITETHRLFPDMILCDYTLDDIPGLELCRRLKKTSLASHIPVMILSKESEAEIIEACFEAGVQDVLLYPYEQEENINKITSVIAPPKKGQKVKALVIDDSPMIRNLISKMFKQLGFIVTAAENGLEGLKAAQEDKPDIITCDYDMPVMNGWDFCIEAKKQEEINDIPIIMVTARGTGVDKKKGKVLGVTEYLIKPFKAETLTKIVKRALSDAKKRKEREAISKYVASDVLQNVSDVIEGIKDREPEEKFITLLFADIVSFTPKCERYEPRKIIKILNSFFSEMIKVLLSHEAIVDKLIGDAIVTRFDSGDKKKDAINAVTSAHEMLISLENNKTNWLEPIEIRIGINSGPVILGNIGSEDFRLDFTMIGDNVNIAQRLESQAPPQGCLISSSTYELVQEQVEVGLSKDLTLKGKSETVEAFPLITVRDISSANVR